MNERVQSCPKCNAQLELSQELVGCLLECPSCGVQFSIEPVYEPIQQIPTITLEATRTDTSFTPEQLRLWKLDSEHRKRATQLKKEKQYLEAVDELFKAREYAIALKGCESLNTLMRVPQYLLMAEKYHETVLECIKICNNEIPVAGYDFKGSHKEYDRTKSFSMYVAHEAFLKMNNPIMGAAFLAGSRTAEYQMKMHELTRFMKPRTEVKSVRGIKKTMESFYFISEEQKKVVEKILVDAWFHIYNANPLEIAQKIERELSS